MPKRVKIWIACTIATFLLAATNIHRCYAFFYEVEGATVILKGCRSNDCAMRGTLHLDAWNGDYLLSKANGEVVRFSADAFSEISVPAPRPTSSTDGH